MPTADELAGMVLHGDDFSPEEISAWFSDEENAYAELYASDPNYEYEYEPFNRFHGFDRLPKVAHFKTIAGLGAAFGDELRPIVSDADLVYIIESSDSYRERPALDVPTTWLKATIMGDIELPDSTCDLVTSFGVLHHVPNVSHVLMEMGRITRRGGYALVREPVISMGDWSMPRPGLTPRERGIPYRLLKRAIRDAGFEIDRASWCQFSLVGLFARWTGIHPFVYRAPVVVDAVLSRLFRWNYRYHARTRWQKIRPTSVFFVLKKTG